MQVTVLDWNFKFMESFDAQYLNGVLVHKRDERKILFWKLGGYTEELEFDYHKTIDVGKTRLALYQWDGKNLHQLSFFDVPESSTLVDFKNTWELAKLSEETALRPPEEKFMKWAVGLWGLAVIISGLANVWAIYHVGNVYTQLVNKVPAYNISVQNSQVLQLLQKEINITQRQLGATDSYIYNVSLRLNNGG